MYYAIRTSLGEEIFDNWDDCVKFRDMAPKNAKFKKFTKIEDAHAFLKSPQSEVLGNNKIGCTQARRDAAAGTLVKSTANPVPNYNWTCPHVIAYTDGSFNAATGYWGYGVVLQDECGHELAVYSGNGTEYVSSRNVTGEVHGAVRAIQTAIQQCCKSIIVKHDYEGVGAWPDGRWKTNLPLTVWYKNKIDELRKQIDVTFKRVPGHQGVAGNERADELARKACFGIDL